MTPLKRSQHISYSLADHESKNRQRIRNAIVSLVIAACEKSNKLPKDMKVLDCGCGLGLLMRDLRSKVGCQVIGLDFDEECLRIARKFGDCLQADINDIDRLFSINTFDIIITSHSLEHMKAPVSMINKMKNISKEWLILAIPNPIRPKILFKYALRNRNYSNKGHYYSWDRSHFHNFLEIKCQLKIVKWETDYVQVMPGKYLRKIPGGPTLLDLLEVKIIPKMFPYFSTSLISLCKVH